MCCQIPASKTMYSSGVYSPLPVSNLYFQGLPSSATARRRPPHSKAGMEPNLVRCPTIAHPDAFRRKRAPAAASDVSSPEWHRRKRFPGACPYRGLQHPSQTDHTHHQTIHNRSVHNRLTIRGPVPRKVESTDRDRTLLYVHRVGLAYSYVPSICHPMKYISPASRHISDKRRRIRPQRRPDSPATVHS